MSFEKLKLNKQIVTACQEAGFVTPKTVQEKCVNRFGGGQDWVVIAPEGAGKTTSYIMSIIMQLKYAFEDAPRALVFCLNKELVQRTVEQFELLAKNTDLRIASLVPGGGNQEQRDELFGGVDIVVGTPDRVSSIYYNSGLNLNKIKILVLDDAELLIKQGFQAQIYAMSEAIPKCQKLVFSEVYHDKLDKLVKANLLPQGVIEVTQEVEQTVEVVEQGLYNVLNYKTKLNLLNNLLGDRVGQKTVVFCNTKLTAGQLFTSVSKRLPGQIAMLNPLFYNQQGIDSLEDFYEIEELSVVLVDNEDSAVADLDFGNIPNMLHFDVPVDFSVLLNRIQRTSKTLPDQVGEVFSTDIELSVLKKMENEYGVTFRTEELPMDLVVQENRKRKLDEETLADTGAFKPKASPKKDNLGTKQKIKLFGKARKKRGKHDI